eukprot:TRINITY_DN14739_c0_g1_i1.p1 TRINITY_DN14739_c0_g1~~TRINITY_DN14739_c0_g1_i1.p1  ORF type:complete len:1191 (+),score=248.14 TRINITY_DN14739_c0_g1_i1:46-3618(+)
MEECSVGCTDPRHGGVFGNPTYPVYTTQLRCPLGGARGGREHNPPIPMETFAAGDRVAFREKEHSWVLGHVVKIENTGKKEVFTCKADEFPGQTFNVETSLLLYKASDDLFNEEPDDLLLLTELHEATLLNCLKRRFLRDVVYTNIGTLVVALNPFKKIPCYQPENTIKDYLAEGPVVQNQLPHVWSIAHQTYYELVNDRQNQTILISGESGAGKTVAAKIVVEYLTAVSCQHATAQIKDVTHQVGVKVQAASPILESFGNAKTVRNDNSSRFGKFMKIQFSPDGFLIGAHTTKYLLEKSRIISAAASERIYHVFYQICSHGDRAKYDLDTSEHYTTCMTGKCLTIDGVDDNEDQTACLAAMDNIGMTEEEKSSVWRTVAGILLYQNVVFGEETDAQNNQRSMVDGENLEILKKACVQFGVDDGVMHKELTSSSSTVGGSVMTKTLSKVKSMDVRDSVSKVMYDTLFQWLVDKINSTTDATTNAANWLGLLDIFGFEDFETNSFEQLCINLANEALQGHYNSYIFEEDMKECQREGIDTTGVDFADNKACLDLLSGKKSVFAMLDEECALPKGSDKDLLQKLHDAFGPGQGKNASPGHEFYGKPRGADILRKHPSGFIIRHYAGDVVYDVVSWLEKNKEPLKDEMKLLIRGSSDKLIASLLPPPPDKSRPTATVTVSGFFKDQVNELISLINSTNPHWVRCVKPHPDKKPLLWHPKQVMNQLRSAGVIETVRVRKAGYPIRFKHQLFCDRYCALLGSDGLRRTGNEDPSTVKALCQRILDTAKVDKATGQMGTTKVFLKQGAFITLNSEKEKAVDRYIRVVQRCARGRAPRHQCFWLYVKKHKARLEAEVKEKEAQAERDRAHHEMMRKAEEEANRKREQELASRIAGAAVTVNKLVRGYLCRKRLLKQFIEEERAKEEYRIDEMLYKQNKAMAKLDAQRLKWEEKEAGLQRKLTRDKKKTIVGAGTADFENEVKTRSAKMLKEKLVKKKEEQRAAYDAKLTNQKKVREEEREKKDAERRRKMAVEDQMKRVSAVEVQQIAQDKFLRELAKKDKVKELAGDDRAKHFRIACKRFEAHDDWEHNREFYLAQDHANRTRQERPMRNKQWLVDNDYYSNPPNVLLGPDLTAERGVPSILTQRQKALEQAYQQRVHREYDLLQSAGVDPIEELQRDREARLEALRAKRSQGKKP